VERARVEEEDEALEDTALLVWAVIDLGAAAFEDPDVDDEVDAVEGRTELRRRGTD
jgi:hypothetical protein